MRILLILISLLSFCPTTKLDAQEWISLKTPHFELYTTNTEEQGRETLHVLEGVRAFFQQTTSLIGPTERPLRVIAFRSREEYAPFRLQATSFAHYLHSRRGDYIVLQDISREHRRAAIHEYTHYIFRTAGLNLPIWLCEGTADLYSSLEIDGTRAMLGTILPSRYRSVQEANLIALPELFSADTTSPLYNDAQKVSLFYGQSWALVHMLAFHPRYRAQFGGFLAAVSRGLTCEQAFEQIYGVRAGELADDLSRYLPHLGEQPLATDLQKITFDGAERALLSPVEAALTMADLLAAHRATAAKAKDRLASLTTEDKKSPRAEELLSYLAAQETRSARR